jgi:flagellin
MSDITLTEASRNALLSLSNTQELSGRTQGRLTTGKKVNNVLDDAVAYFQSKALSDRATDLVARKSAIDQGVSSATSAVNGTNGVDTLLKQLQALINQSKTQTAATNASTTTAFREVFKQLNQLIKDTTYQGLNLLQATSAKLSVQFSERTASTLNINGYNLTYSVTGKRTLFTLSGILSGGSTLKFSTLFAVSAAGFVGFSGINIATGVASLQTTFQGYLDKGFNRLGSAIRRLQGFQAELGTYVSVLQTRAGFTKEYINTLNNGADKLVLADLNEEGANLTALQTRQQLGIQSLSIANQTQSAILQLLR